MKPTVRAWPFESKYLRDFAVVEERRGNVRLFPATEQLPLLSKAIDQEFRDGLTTRLASTDARGDTWRKLQLKEAAFTFCTLLNSARPDHLHVQPYLTPDLITQIAVIQQISESSEQGMAHRFRHFRGENFLPDVFLSGKRVVFTSHVFDRYAQRAMVIDGTAVVELYTAIFGSIVTTMLVSGRPALTLTTGSDCLLAFPYKESADEFLFLTTLSQEEISSLETPVPMRRLHFHYGRDYREPVPGAFDLEWHCGRLVWIWGKHTPVPEPLNLKEKTAQMSWTRLMQLSKASLAAQGIHPDTSMELYDGVHGPCVLIKNRRDPTPPRAAPASTSPATPPPA